MRQRRWMLWRKQFYLLFVLAFQGQYTGVLTRWAISARAKMKAKTNLFICVAVWIIRSLHIATVQWKPAFKSMIMFTSASIVLRVSIHCSGKRSIRTCSWLPMESLSWWRKKNNLKKLYVKQQKDTSGRTADSWHGWPAPIPQRSLCTTQTDCGCRKPWTA